MMLALFQNVVVEYISKPTDTNFNTNKVQRLSRKGVHHKLLMVETADIDDIV